ncbi:hypothetical protein POM88_002154 [Heracleum sosnowskyi]|uniref:Uncharacterized protein n=1 Tax=Heracleum sosnowskyi TaxID=360622 RepID=A0AAD8JE80_9APIA|nr:hypothetical protein POM88_002154 [Heracleum sosnowskyi]
MRFPGERDDYYIVIRLANGKILLAEEDYVKVNSDTTLKPVERDVETVEGVVVALGREFYTCKLLESSGVIRKDHPYFGCELLVSSTCSGSEVLEGGLLITEMGHGCGINFFDGSKFVHPLPTSVIYSCLDKWNSSCIVMRPCTAVVKEVYEGSPADKVGLHSGETVTALMRSQRKITIDSASEYARTLSNISGELSACCLNNTPEILYVVHAEILRVNDKKFCCSWVADGSDDPDWDINPRFGSQREAAHEIYDVHENGINTNVILEPMGSETGTHMILE